MEYARESGIPDMGKELIAPDRAWGTSSLPLFLAYMVECGSSPTIVAHFVPKLFAICGDGALLASCYVWDVGSWGERVIFCVGYWFVARSGTRGG